MGIAYFRTCGAISGVPNFFKRLLLPAIGTTVPLAPRFSESGLQAHSAITIVF